ncbi:lipopolysaccharide biosynthesis protein [Marinomonas gallaica]|uniref:lipopolysaccharide biosynthesis protein n=1 Tax=Marinomonas gallaica TaxID=1806667 RepID=UPI003A91EEE5
MSKKILSNSVYKSAEIITTQGVQLLFSIALARILSPADFGVFALVMITTQICCSVITSGMAMAIIQKDVVTEKQKSTTFYILLGVSLLVYIILFLFRIEISTIFGNDKIAELIPFAGIIVITTALGQVSNSLIIKSMKFKLIFKINIISLILSSFITILIALKGGGVWSLIFQQVILTSLKSILSLFFGDWRPKLKFEIRSVSDLYSFGKNLTISNIIGTLFNNLYTFIIGRNYSVEVLGFYNRGKQFPSVLVTLFSGVISSVIFPILSRAKSDKYTFKNILSDSIDYVYILYVPLAVVLYFCSESIILFIFTEKWLPVVPFMKLMVINYLFLPLQGVLAEGINALGRTDLFLKIEIFKKVALISVLFFSIEFGLIGVIYGQIFISSLSAFVNYYAVRNVLNCKLDLAVLGVIFNVLICFLLGLAVFDFISGYISTGIVFVVLYSILFLCLYFVYVLIFRKEMLIKVMALRWAA